MQAYRYVAHLGFATPPPTVCFAFTYMYNVVMITAFAYSFQLLEMTCIIDIKCLNEITNVNRDLNNQRVERALLVMSML